MNLFQHPLWGYQITLPTQWKHQKFGDKDGFALDLEAFQEEYQGDILAQLLISGEWNGLRKPIQDIWNQHLSRTTLMLGAKNIGSAPWELGGARGYEVEVVLPKKSKKRLWVGILQYGMLVLQFMVLHWLENKSTIEPILSKSIASLEFMDQVENIRFTPSGLPLPPNSKSVDPGKVIPDIADLQLWTAYQGDFSAGSLQAFYLRELPPAGWQVSRYVPYPNRGELPFARLMIENNRKAFTIGLLPKTEQTASSIIIKDRTESAD